MPSPVTRSPSTCTRSVSKSDALNAPEAIAKMSEGWSGVPSSAKSKRTVNPIRAIVDSLKIPKNPPKPLLRLSLGDPTVFGNMNVPDSVVDSICANVRAKRCNGYLPSNGLPAARAAIAKKFSSKESPLTADDVIINSGASGAVRMCIETLLNPGETILLPKPGFPLYETCAVSHGANVRYYSLVPSLGWQADVKELDKLVDAKTRVLLINNPSNPCGSVFSEAHLRELAAFAARHRLVIVADEIYADIVFPGESFIPIASVSTEAPVLSIGGLAKQYAVPGWRVGWILLHDRKGRLGDVREGLLNMTRLILGANSLVQHSIPDMLHKTDTKYYTAFNKQLEDQAKAFTDVFAQKDVPGIKLIKPQGAMYCMLEVDPAAFEDVKDGTVFAQKLLEEEFVFVLPGACFMSPQHFRCVFLAPEKTLQEAANRIVDFATRHAIDA